MEKRRNRVAFYSESDLSAGYNLANAESIILDFNPKKDFSINDIIELFQIKSFFDRNLYLPNWTEEIREHYGRIVKTFWNTITSFYLKICDQNVLEIYTSVEYGYQDAFWNLIDIFEKYKAIQPNTFNLILQTERFSIKQVLKQEKIVKYFSKEVRDYLIQNGQTAELLLSIFEEEHLSVQPIFYIPLNLSDSDKESIIQKYIDSNKPNLNYIRLIVTSKKIKLSERTKLNAKKIADKLNNEIIEKGTTWKLGVQISIAKSQVEPVIKDYNFEEGLSKYTYSEDWLNSTNDPIGIISNFSNLFGYLNYQACIDLVRKNSEIDVLERVLMHSKNEYHIYSKFHQKSMLSLGQLYVYSQYLNEKNIKIENALSFIVNEYLNKAFDIKCLQLNFPSDNSSPLEKIRILAPELDFLIKQYKSYVEEDFVDFELLRFSSTPLNLNQVPSRVIKKYVYGQGTEFHRLKYDFFSDQSLLYYVDPFKDKHRNLYQLLTIEDVPYRSFENYQKDEIDYLISNDYLYLDEKNSVKIKNNSFIFIIGILYIEEVINYWHYPEDIRNEILFLEQKGYVKFERSLFTIEERKYLNFHLNQKEFSNGLDLRNKYLHGTNTISIKEQQNDYYSLLKILILVILKIIDDLIIEQKEK